MTFVTDKQCEAALDYLRDQSPEVGRLKAAMVRADEQRKVARELAFLSASGSVAERSAHAVTSGDYLAAVDELERATADYETARLTWRAAEIKVEVWRSLNSRATRGHV
jgi:hypothetical protein